MFKRIFKKKRSSPADSQPAVPEGEAVMELAGRTVTRSVVPVVGESVLELAYRNGVDWNSNCKKGNCARCRCLVSEGAELLTEPNDAELARLEEDELAQGYRLGCQTKVVKAGTIKIRHASYF